MTSVIREGDDLHAELIAEWLLRDGLRTLLVFMGLPASGKSTLCEKLEARGAIRVNRDNIRQRLYGDASKLGDPKEVNREYYRELREALAKGGPVISDNVNVTIFHRRGTLSAAAEAGYKRIKIVWVDVPLEVALARNAARDRKVPEDAVRDLHSALMAEGGPSPDEGDLVILQNGMDMSHYKIAKIRQGTTPPAAEPAPKPTKPEVDNMTQPTPSPDDQRRKLVTDLHTQVNLLDACVAAGRNAWAGETLTLIQALSAAGITLFGVTDGATTTTPAKPGGRAKKEYPPITPEQVTEVLLRWIGSRPIVGNDGPLVMLCFNGHLLTKEKAEHMVGPLSELIKRAHIVFFQETNVDAMRTLGKAVHYGLMASHRNKREQACGYLVHPRLEWIGQAPIYHDYLLDVPGHPEYKETMRPAVQRRMRDRVTGFVFDVLNFHGKSNLGGPDATRPVREWQLAAIMKELAKQKEKSPWTKREQAAKPASTASDATPAATPAALPVDDTAHTLPLGPCIIGGDYNTPIEQAESTEMLPVTNAGFTRISTPENHWSYQYRGRGGQFDGFYVRDMDGMVGECFIPPFTDNKRDETFYGKEMSDHRPVFMVIQPPAAATEAEPAPAPAVVADGDGKPAAAA